MARKKERHIPRGVKFEAVLVDATLTKMNMNAKHVILEFKIDGTELHITEELDLLDDHTMFRFSMFLESFGIKSLKHARKMLNVFIREKILIGLMINLQNEIIYSNMLVKKQSDEFKKYNLLDQLKRTKKINKEMYNELKGMSYKEVRSVVK